MELTIRREERRNALDNAVIDEMMRALAGAADDGTRVIIVTSEGRRAFCSGSDVKALKDMTPDERARHAVKGQALMDSMTAHPCVLVAAVEGFAVGGGFELALACDLIVAGESSVFRFPEVSRGMLPGWGGTYRLSRSVGLLAAKTLILGGASWSAADAAARGVVFEVTRDGGAVDRAREIAQELSSVSDKEAFSLAKSLLNSGVSSSDAQGRLLESLGEALRATRRGYAD